MKKLYVFDLDGVLIDSKLNMESSWNIVQQRHNIETPFELYFERIGIPFYDILTQLGITENQKAIKHTYDTTSMINSGDVSVYDGVIETITTLKSRGSKVAIVTSKCRERTEKMIGKLPDFDYIGCPNETFRGKPAPDHLFSAMAYCNTDKEDTVYIGDMHTDYECANRAGVDFIFASYGYGEVNCKQRIESITQLV